MLLEPILFQLLDFVFLNQKCVAGIVNQRPVIDGVGIESVNSVGVQFLKSLDFVTAITQELYLAGINVNTGA